MKKSTRYVFGAALAGVALSGVPGLVDRAHAAPLVTNADFTFEGLTATGSTAGGASFGSYLADIGTGTAYGVHAASLAAYSEPAGNGSAKSFSSTDWAIGDYYQFSVPTTSIMGIQVSFDEIGSNSGPAQFSLLYSTDGTTFLTAGNYTVSSISGTVSAPQSFWAASLSQSFYNHAFDLSAITGLNNDGSVIFRVQDAGTLAFSSSGPAATGGTDRVDNFVVSGSSVPEPASMSLLTVAAAGLLMRRRPTK